MKASRSRSRSRGRRKNSSWIKAARREAGGIYKEMDDRKGDEEQRREGYRG